ncbi:hypothetical protein EG332_13885 [Pectobacterium versatile]|nr:hypothetical protein EG332_13885 [Pectobacterium versatile]
MPGIRAFVQILLYFIQQYQRVMNIAANKLFIFQRAVGWFPVHEREHFIFNKGSLFKQRKKG